MSTRSTPVQLPELAAAAPLDYVEAVTIVREIALRVARDELPGVPSAHVIRMSPCGSMSVEGPIAAGGSAVRRAAHLLESLLPAFGGHGRVPGALRLIVGRAVGALDLPPYPSLESFADALSRFAALDPAECFRQIVANRQFDPRDAVSAETFAGLRDLGITVSDIRRARRATRVPLGELSRRCGVPVHLLRELEWGYFDNWPGSHVGRRLIVSYAKAAGLDERLVTETVWPLLMQSVRTRGALALNEPPALPTVIDAAVEPVRPTESCSTSLARIEPAAPPRRWNARRVIAALTIPALIAIGATPALLERSAERRAAQHQTAATAQPQAVTPPVPRVAQPPVRGTDVVIATPTRVDKSVRGAVIVRQATYRSPEGAASKRPRTSAAKSAKPPQRRALAPRDKGRFRWGVWVLNKVGVRIVSTEQQ